MALRAEPIENAAVDPFVALRFALRTNWKTDLMPAMEKW